MTCKECEIQLYVFNERNDVEHATAEEHLRDCPDCQAKYVQINADLNNVLANAKMKPVLRDPQQFTAKVMDSLPVMRETKSSFTFRSLIFFPVSKFSLAGVSVAMIVLFVMQQRTEIPVQQHFSISGKAVSLNTRSFLATVDTMQVQKKERRMQTLLTYAHTQHNDNSIFKNFRRNLTHN